MQQTPAAILAGSDQIAARADDPIYGTALRETWHALQRYVAGTVDFGLTAATAWVPQDEALLPLLAPRANAPLLLPRDASLWSCTAPMPAVDPAVSLYLHGPDAAPG